MNELHIHVLVMASGQGESLSDMTIHLSNVAQRSNGRTIAGHKLKQRSPRSQSIRVKRLSETKSSCSAFGERFARKGLATPLGCALLLGSRSSWQVPVLTTSRYANRARGGYYIFSSERRNAPAEAYTYGLDYAGPADERL